MNWALWKYCPHCGANLNREKGFSENTKLKCLSCGEVFYRNPVVGVAVILLEREKILLVKRKGSYENSWCIPCGYVEWGEEVRKAAQREFFEETGLVVEVSTVFDVLSNFHDPSNLTVGIWFMGKLKGGNLRAGSDAKEVGFFPLDNLPKPMAFPTDVIICRKLLENLKK